MESNAKFDLHPVWESLINVYREIAKICEKHSLRYWAAYGTAIGAVRHHGFIPWDDDLDLMMPREDYDKFLQFADTELPPYMKIVSIYNTKEYHWAFGKVQDCRIEELQRVQQVSHCHLPDGIYIDIFPLDGCPRSFLHRLGRMVKSASIHLSRKYGRGKGYSFYQRLVGWIAGLFSPSFKDEREYKLYEINRLKSPMFNGSVHCGYRVDGITRENGSRPLRVTCFDGTTRMPFEGIDMPVPNGFDEILRAWYGDYMTLPPLENRQLPSHANDPIVAWRLGPTGLE